MKKSTKYTLAALGAAAFGVTAGMGIGGYISFLVGIKNTDKAKSRAIENSQTKDNNALNIDWFNDRQPEPISMLSDDGLQLKASFLRQPTPTKHTVILAHGYHHARMQMIPYAKIFYNMGYNVLMPDARSHGESQGNLIGFGWLDRRDYIRWMQRAVLLTHPDEKIVLMGISMGAATVIAAAGEPDVPGNLVAVIEDSSFNRLDQQFRHRLKRYYHLPSQEFGAIASAFTKKEAGYSFKEANIQKQIQKVKVPIMFIHGEADRYVPIEMLDELVDATRVPCWVYLVDQADHVQALATNPRRYRDEVAGFLKKYVD
jgi:dipeptidyl aminopeptidase/acylaminoacyl peptidase